MTAQGSPSGWRLCRPAVRGALKGCLALLSRRGSAAPARPALAEVEEAAAVEMMRACVSHVFIRALAQQDRTVALRLVTAAMRGYGAALLDAGLDLFEYLVSSGGWRCGAVCGMRW